MEVVMRLGICLLSFALIGGAVQAQQIPASSVSGTYRAVAGIAVPSIPSNICTADNGLCYNSSSPPPTSVVAAPTSLQGSYCGQVIYTAPDSLGNTPSGYAPQGTTSERHCNGSTLSLSGPWYAPTGIANCPSGYLSGMTGPAIPGFTYQQSAPDGGTTTIYGGATSVFTCFKS
ncbi:hypothetical protein Rfer_4491 (plasmid) [Rhodoferax ferrireducens T118]|uniref:Uncharacterized protein n=1 Tax=Albidiferax ferrireducens (strain ATCC BAA-621 / DSM 15236 / T118) TaxID=338969 RepID=Q21PW9_ALBFT|nr:hypothetical protein Rfer_4491 [Rhodoferax ferrireducens T118]